MHLKEFLNEVFCKSNQIVITKLIKNDFNNIRLSDWIKNHNEISISKERGLYWFESDIIYEANFNKNVNIGINFNNRICDNLNYIKDFLIDNNNKLKVVYNGQAKNINNRLGQHLNESKGTGSLNIVNNTDSNAKNNIWIFKYFSIEELNKLNAPDKYKNLFNSNTGRNFLEYNWRAYNGHPILCKK